MRSIEDQFETTDGSRPDAAALDEDVAKKFPIAAFHLLSQGDVFESSAARPPQEGPRQAREAVAQRVKLHAHGASTELLTRVRADLARQLEANLSLSGRLLKSKPIEIDLVPPGQNLVKLGYPRAVSPRASGIFWDHPSWPAARIALRQERLPEEPTLVFHEFAHALHYLVFTERERDELYRLLLPTYRSRAAADEVFAVYSEREFVSGFSADDLRGPGIYGHARRRWSEEHVMTRFVRNLYLPHKPLAGPRPGF